MARVVILGAGVAGHGAATLLGDEIGKEHEVVVVAPNSHWNYIPSNVWVGTGYMNKEEVRFPLRPIYEKCNVDFRQAKALSIHPEGKEESDKSYVTVEYVDPAKQGETEEIEYDYLINATGPKLNFAKTPGLGDENGIGDNTVSICTADHATHAHQKLEEVLEKAKSSKQKIVVGTSDGTCTCQGAAFEYILNIEQKARKMGVRDNVDIRWISNEPYVGEFGVDGLHLGVSVFDFSSKIFGESLFAERGIHWTVDSHVHKIEPGKLEYEQIDGSMHEMEYDFAMLIPQFTGVGLKAYNKAGEDITDVLFMPNGFMKVDADYTPKPYEKWKASDWPSTYQNPTYGNIFAAGIAFAPPHPISEPRKSPNGTPITPAPPRTGMPSATIAEAVAHSIKNLIKDGENAKLAAAPLTEVGALCVASAGIGFKSGQGASFTMYPIVKNYEKYPGTGRSTSKTFGSVGLYGHWLKKIMHYMFIYKAKLKPGWKIIPG